MSKLTYTIYYTYVNWNVSYARIVYLYVYILYENKQVINGDTRAGNVAPPLTHWQRKNINFHVIF